MVMAAVPNVVGLTRLAAEEKLKSADLALGEVTTATSDVVSNGGVISSAPPAGTDVSSGSTVNLQVSSGPAQVPGQPVRQAIARDVHKQRDRPYSIDRNDAADRSWFFQIKGTNATFSPSEEEKSFINHVNGKLGELNAYGKSGNFSDTKVAEGRDAYSKTLADLVQHFIEAGNIDTLSWTAAYELGCFETTVNQLKQLDSFVLVKIGKSGLPYDIEFNVDAVSSLTEDQEKLVNDVRRAFTVVNVVLGKKKHKSYLAHKIMSIVNSARTEAADKEVLANIADRRSHYIFKLADIARMGTAAPGRVRFANSLLEGFKSDFVSLEGDFVKNRYVEKLGTHALAIGTLFWLPYVVLDLFRVHHGFFHTYKSFLLLAAAACAGTWLSFSLRRVTLGFADLANLEEDRLKPTMRLLFVIGLTWVIALFIAARIIDFKIGEVPLTANLLHSGLIAVLMGVVCGISERALASVVSKRSDELIGKMSGKLGPTQPPV
jgi:hypothetical protein